MVDAVVVGAGLSGLSAARRLVARGRSVVVLEGRDRVGGRTWSPEVGGYPFDLGAQWVGPGQDRVLALIDELGLDTFLQPDRGARLLGLRGEVRRYPWILPRVSVPGLLEAGYHIGALSLAARRVDRERPWTSPGASDQDRRTVAEYLDRRVRSDDARALLRIATQMIFAAEPEQLSELWFKLYVHAGGNLLKLSEVRRGAQDRKVVGGTQQISVRLADELGDRLRTGAPVHAIEGEDDGIRVRGPWGEVRARRAILALAPAHAASIDVRPALPAARLELHRTMPMGSVLKTVAVYARPFWRDRGLSGEAIRDAGPIRAVFDNAPPAGPASLVAFTVGSEVEPTGALDDETRRRTILDGLAELFGPEAREPVAYADKDWSGDPFAAGCYGGLGVPGLLTSCGEALRRPAGRIHFAGTETATRWIGYMDGAIEAGERAADEVHSAPR